MADFVGLISSFTEVSVLIERIFSFGELSAILYLSSR